MTGKRLEVELTVRAADEIRSPGFEIVHHIDNVVDPYARERGINEFAVVTEDVLEMKLRAVVRADGGGEASARHRGRSAGGAALGHLDDANAGLRAFECGHGAGRAAANDQHVGLVMFDGNFEAREFGLHCHLCCVRPLRFQRRRLRRHRQR